MNPLGISPVPQNIWPKSQIFVFSLCMSSISERTQEISKVLILLILLILYHYIALSQDFVDSSHFG